jgi:hypothetical protein
MPRWNHGAVMTMSKCLFLLLLAVIPISAQTPIPTPILSFDWIIGKWECKGVTPAGKIDYTFAQQIERPSGSRWFRFRAVSKSGDVDSELSSDTSFETYDPHAHLWRYFSFYDSGVYSMGTAPDFVNNKQSWTGYIYENGVRKSWGRIVFIKVNDQEKREEFYKVHKGGKEEFAGSEVCTKVK